MKRIYLSGPMTGLPDLNFPAFAAMTTNQTIDGVSRELLERLLVATAADSTPANPAWYVEELRAMLDAPAVERKTVKRYERDSVAGHCDVEIALPEHKILHHDHGPNLAEALARLAGRVARFRKLEAPSLAAQHQGDPVALTQDAIDRIVPSLNPEPDRDEFHCEWALWSDRERIRGKLSALLTANPAPVSVVQPVDPERARLMEIVQQYPNVDPLKYDAAVRTLRK